MSNRSEVVESLVGCGEWLREGISEWTNPVWAGDLQSAQAELRGRIDTVLLFTAQHECLPVKAALHLQLTAQDSWNSVFLLSWPSERATLKRGAQHLAALLFLFSHHVFAPPEVFAAHMAHHIDEAEKCILMSLKVSKSLLRHNAVEEAQRMLTWSSTVIAACRDPSQVRLRQYTMEMRFAQLHLLWQSNQLEEACAVAQTLAHDTQDSTTYREALFEFIYEAALHTACKADNAQQKTAATPHANSAAPAEVHAALQKLLVLSLDLQSPEKVRTVRQQTFLGMTELQLSCSLLTTGSYAKAVDAAGSAYNHLQTFEPLLVRLRAESLRHGVEEVSRLFAAVCAHNGVVVAELCAVATCVVESNPDMEREISGLLHRRVTSTSADAGEEDHFRYLCFLLHARSEWSISELMRLVTTATKPLATSFHRFFFCSLWQLAVGGAEGTGGNSTAEDTTSQSTNAVLSLLPPALRWRCLMVAMQLFAPLHSSSAERQSVLLEMSRLALGIHADRLTNTTEVTATTAFVCHADDGDVENSVSEVVLNTWNLWMAEIPEESVHFALHVPILLTQAQLAFVLDKRDEGLRRVEAIWSDGDEDVSVRACGTLVNFFLTHSLFEMAGSIARLCLPRLASQSLQCALDFAKVFALGCLASSDDLLEGEVAEFVLAYICPLWLDARDEGDAAFTPSVASWWSRFLWYVSDGLADASPALAVRLSFAAVCLHAKYFLSEGPVAALLTRRLGALLEAEVDRFVEGQPTLSLAEIQHAHALLASRIGGTAEEENANEDTSSAFHERMKVALCLADIEVELRRMEQQQRGATVGPELAHHLHALPDLPCIEVVDLERVAAACHRVAAGLSRACPPLHCAAVSLQLAAAELHCRQSAARDDKEGVCATLSLFYEAYCMANDADARSSVFAAIMKLLSEDAVPFGGLLRDVLQNHVLDGSSQSGHVSRLVETTVEFFAVEAWNESVQWNVLEIRNMVAVWRAWAFTLADMLDSASASKAAIADLSSQMPLL